MELSFRELRRRDVINVADGRCLGRVSDVIFEFPKGNLTGIAVPEKKCKGILRYFDKSELYIDEKNIIKIGNDVILVNLKCGEVCAPNVRVGVCRDDRSEDRRDRDRPPKRDCPPQRPVKNDCPPSSGKCMPDCERLFGGEDGRMDPEDY